LNALCQRRIFAASSPHNTITSALTMGGVRGKFRHQKRHPDRCDLGRMPVGSDLGGRQGNARRRFFGTE